MPKPNLPAWRHIDGAAGTALLGVRDAVGGILEQKHLFGAHVGVTFPGAGTSVKVTSGLTGPVTGYRVERSSVDVRVFDGTPPSGITPGSGEIWLQASAAATVTLYLY